jgi:hypothetical protein
LVAHWSKAHTLATILKTGEWGEKNRNVLLSPFFCLMDLVPAPPGWGKSPESGHSPEKQTSKKFPDSGEVKWSQGSPSPSWLTMSLRCFANLSRLKVPLPPWRGGWCGSFQQQKDRERESITHPRECREFLHWSNEGKVRCKYPPWRKLYLVDSRPELEKRQDSLQ